MNITLLTGPEEARVTFGYRMSKNYFLSCFFIDCHQSVSLGNTLFAKATVTCICYDSATLKPVVLPPHIRDRLIPSIIEQQQQQQQQQR
jgi:acyl-CoA thioesterase FadM